MKISINSQPTTQTPKLTLPENCQITRNDNPGDEAEIRELIQEMTKYINDYLTFQGENGEAITEFYDEDGLVIGVFGESEDSMWCEFPLIDSERWIIQAA